MTDESVSQPIEGDDALSRASQRLDKAVEAVSRRMQALQAQLHDAEGSVVASRDSDEDRARLAASLDEARAREVELTQAVRDAGDVLDDAMSDIAKVLGLDEAGT